MLRLGAKTGPLHKSIFLGPQPYCVWPCVAFLQRGQTGWLMQAYDDLAPALHLKTVGSFKGSL